MKNKQHKLVDIRGRGDVGGGIDMQKLARAQDNFDRADLRTDKRGGVKLARTSSDSNRVDSRLDDREGVGALNSSLQKKRNK
jgi:hypothetical protein